MMRFRNSNFSTSSLNIMYKVIQIIGSRIYRRAVTFLVRKRKCLGILRLFAYISTILYPLAVAQYLKARFGGLGSETRFANGRKTAYSPAESANCNSFRRAIWSGGPYDGGRVYERKGKMGVSFLPSYLLRILPPARESRFREKDTWRFFRAVCRRARNSAGGFALISARQM